MKNISGLSKIGDWHKANIENTGKHATSPVAKPKISDEENKTIKTNLMELVETMSVEFNKAYDHFADKNIGDALVNIDLIKSCLKK